MRQAVEIWCEGSRLAADLHLPDGLVGDQQIPAILLCHGWGGLKEHLTATYAPWFAKAGFAALTFDYRGWGESEVRTVPGGELREVVDPYEQIRDITSCLDFLEGQPRIDVDRIGLWGSSYGGGHVSYMAAHDPRVKAIVAQVGAQQPALAMAEHARQRAVARARGEIGAAPPGEDAAPGLAGTPDLAKMRFYRPLATASLIRVPTLVIDAEEEELFDRREHGLALYEIVRQHAPARYETFPCKHYAIYDQYYRPASTLARDWFVEHLQS